ncbi:hypothetical protein J2793_007105 [Paraburkholderia caledonica]|uniref:Uncharacterized protein n=1 Tax=Paraburkholderia caledonica TaxID=134536 RepID=A0AB73INP8_9BURK|nr:hypothetical protein [Paraburkholderia caledonica]
MRHSHVGRPLSVEYDAQELQTVRRKSLARPTCAMKHARREGPKVREIKTFPDVPKEFLVDVVIRHANVATAMSRVLIESIKSSPNWQVAE